MKLKKLTYPVKNISISIDSPRDTVYRYASDPSNFPAWLAFVKSIARQSENVWNAETSLGQISFELVPQNDFGVIDQVVTLPDDSKVSNILRVVENNEGSEVIFTLFRMPGRSDAEFEEDAQAVREDLEKLKELLEKIERRQPFDNG